MIWVRPTSVPEELEGKEFWAYRIADGYLFLLITRGFVERVHRCSY